MNSSEDFESFESLNKLSINSQGIHNMKAAAKWARVIALIIGGLSVLLAAVLVGSILYKWANKQNYLQDYMIFDFLFFLCFPIFLLAIAFFVSYQLYKFSTSVKTLSINSAENFFDPFENLRKAFTYSGIVTFFVFTLCAMGLVSTLISIFRNP